ALPPALPVLRARLEPGPQAAALRGARVLAFSGIARPEKFFASLQQAGAILAGRVPFPDHHTFTARELSRLRADAARLQALPVTTAKDAVRLPAEIRAAVRVLGVRLVWEHEAALEALLARMPAA
ncbi:MAG: tetraacyldisaccharide 4'-kinase, partial [Rhodospirillales bacterium]|nr:tetraacyldisaccharide 4'-kinase [Rhodospirillales bacterium]